MTDNIQDSEQKPLLETSIETVNVDLKLKIPKWLAITLVMTIALLHMAAGMLSFYVMNQYSYQAYMRQNYPNSSHVSTGSQSACEKNTNTTAYQEQIVVQKLTSEWNIHCNLVTYNIIGIVITLNLATYSDVYGRKLLFIPPIVGSILKNTLCSVGIYFNLNIEWFILFYAIEGCTGSWISLLSMAYSFIADLTEAGKPRSFIIGLLEGGMGIGTFLATILSGYLIKWTGGFFYPEVTSVILVGIELLIIMLILSETLHGSKKRNEVSFCQNMARVTECYKSNFSPLTKRWVFVVLIFIFMMSAFSNIGRISVETLYQLNAPFCWDSIRIGWYGAIRMTMLAFGGLAMIKVFHLFTTDEYIALAGCITTVLSLTIMGLANTNTMLYIGKL